MHGSRGAESTFDASVLATILRLARSSARPAVQTLAASLHSEPSSIEASLQRLADDGFIAFETPENRKIAVAPPFSFGPEPVCVFTEDACHFANCLLCGFGVSILTSKPTKLAVRYKDEDATARLEAREGELPIEADGLFHLDQRPWSTPRGVIFPCENYGLFQSSDALDAWCAREGRVRGATLTVRQLWKLARAWFENAIEDRGLPRSTESARVILQHQRLSGPFWRLGPVITARH